MLGVHWLQGTVPHGKVAELLSVLVPVFGEHERWVSGGRYLYDGRYQFENGVTVYADGCEARADRVHRGRATLVVPGAVLECLGDIRTHSLLVALVEVWFVGTRIDAAYDDGHVSMEPVVEAAMTGSYSGYRVCTEVRERRGGKVGGVTVSFGKRGAGGNGRYYRVYDKTVESGGTVVGTRFECEYSGEAARAICWRLAQVPFSGFLRAVGELVGGGIDFVARRGGRLRGAVRLDWWAAIVERLGRAVWRPIAAVGDLESTVAWLRRSCGGAMRRVCRAGGVVSVRQLVEEMLGGQAVNVEVSYVR